MEINKDNYEAYLLDLIEGRLSAQEQQEVRDFLSLNPDCEAGINEIDPWVLEKVPVHLREKEHLKKQLPGGSDMLTENNFDLFSIARLEGDLTEKQESDHARWVAENEEKRREWHAWQQTKLKAESAIFMDKERLKRKTGISRRMIWISVISAAAVIALLFSIIRIDPPAPGSKLAMENTQILAETEDKNLTGTADPVPPEGITDNIVEEEPVKVDHKPALFSIKKKTELPVEPPGEKGGNVTGGDSDSIRELPDPKIRPEMVRIASLGNGYTDILDKGSYDRIKPLDIPATSVHMTSLSISQLAEIDLQEVFDEYTEEKNISLWSIASAGIKGINRLTGSDMSLLASRDEDGDLSGIRFKSKRFSFTTPIERQE